MTPTTSPPTDAVATTTQMYRVYIKASASRIWEALTNPEWTNRYGYTGYVHYDLRPGGALKVLPNDEFKAAAASQGFPCPDVLIDGEVIEVDEPHRLVTTWRMLMDPDTAAEGFTKITYEIKEVADNYCSLTVIHDLTGAPKLALLVSGAFEDQGQGGGGGHAWILSDLKSLLETGTTLAG